MRIDKFLFETGLAKSRAAAQRIIEGGFVKLDGKPVTKASFEVAAGSAVSVEENTEKYVSRGGFKLEAALDAFGIDPTGLDCIDIGASTGGFTDCLLQRGAGFVRAVDVGRSQLDKKIAADTRVRSFEGVNARYITPEDIGGLCELAVCDVSFISLTLIMPAVRGLLREGGRFVALIKPQFEAGRANIGKNGIVKDRDVHIEVINKVLDCGEGIGLYCSGLTASPITGGDGNREYLAVFGSEGVFDRETIKKIAYKN